MMKKKLLVVAIDGPSGVGKTSLAKTLAKKLNWSYCDTGALYRAVTLFFLEHSLSLDDPFVLKKNLKEITLNFNEGRVILNDRDVSLDIRSLCVSDKVSEVSSFIFVRQFLFDLQRKIVQKEKIVMEGRDVGTTICPEALYKFYLQASLKKRSQRRFSELSDGRTTLSLQDIQKNLKKRDFIDSHRISSPLKCHPDAIIIDNDDDGKDRIVEKIYQRIVMS